ncbi:hypothetical protein [Acinetobacter baumannii]|nr:hypothetical protein [Acinetobacter baumannii]
MAEEIKAKEIVLLAVGCERGSVRLFLLLANTITISSKVGNLKNFGDLKK